MAFVLMEVRHNPKRFVPKVFEIAVLTPGQVVTLPSDGYLAKTDPA